MIEIRKLRLDKDGILASRRTTCTYSANGGSFMKKERHIRLASHSDAFTLVGLANGS